MALSTSRGTGIHACQLWSLARSPRTPGPVGGRDQCAAQHADRPVGASTFYAGLEKVCLEDFDYVCKLDMDLADASRC